MAPAGWTRHDKMDPSKAEKMMKTTLDELHTIEELEKALSESRSRPVLLFKHSLTCPISSRAFREFQTYLENADPHVGYKLITVQTARQVAASAADRLGVAHQSPQAILVKNCSSVWDASHYDITSDSLDQAIREFTL
jgi:bacillithiol system protein YtxJ